MQILVHFLLSFYYYSNQKKYKLTILLSSHILPACFLSIFSSFYFFFLPNHFPFISFLFFFNSYSLFFLSFFFFSFPTFFPFPFFLPNLCSGFFLFYFFNFLPFFSLLLPVLFFSSCFNYHHYSLSSLIIFYSLSSPSPIIIFCIITTTFINYQP